MRHLTTAVLFLFWACVANAQQPAVPANATWRHTEVDAVGWAFDALSRYREEDRPYVRFIYLPHYATPEWVGVIDTAVNLACGHTTTLIRGDRHAGGWLLGYRLNRYAPEPTKLAELVRVWDLLAREEAQFHVPQINFEEVVQDGRRIRVPRKTAFLAPHLEAALAKRAAGGAGVRVDVLVTQLTKSTGGIYPAEFFLEMALTSQRGYYPEFRQMFSANRKFTPLQELLRQRGFFLEASRDLRGDKGALILVSDITGKNRLVETVTGIAGTGPLIATYDTKDSRIRPDQQFIRNLVEPQTFADASELFVPMPNGLIEFVLADAKGGLQRAAPPDIVADFTKPDGHTKELEMGMSCIMCHFPHDGYRTARNDMELLLGSDTDFLGDDFSYKGKKLTREEAVALVAGRFGTRIDEPDGILGRARRDLIKAVDVLTDYPVEAGKDSPVQRVGAALKTIYHGYRYGLVDADRACRELGLDVPPGTGRRWLGIVAPAPVAGNEDVVIALLRNGAKIKRDDFDAIRGELARRAWAYREATKKKD